MTAHTDTQADDEKHLHQTAETVVQGAAVLLRGFVGVVLIVGLAALLATGIVFPLWLAATSLTSAYTAVVLGLLAALAIVFVISRVRAQRVRITSEEERKAGRRSRIHRLGVGASVAGLYLGAALLMQVNVILGAVILIASLLAVLWLLGRMAGGVRSDAGA